MAEARTFPMTRQGVRDLDNPRRPSPAWVNVGPEERTASALGGAALAGLGLARGGTAGLLLAAAGGALAYRGLAGHCPLYAAYGVNTAR
jgi:uncharacterized membrane protein